MSMAKPATTLATRHKPTRHSNGSAVIWSRVVKSHPAAAFPAEVKRAAVYERAGFCQ